jgi:hypothetical protein
VFKVTPPIRERRRAFSAGRRWRVEPVPQPVGPAEPVNDPVPIVSET